METLTEKQKEMLRFLVQENSAGRIPDEFTVFWALGKPAVAASGGFREVPVTRLGLEALTLAGMLLSDSHAESRSSGFGSSITQRVSEASRTCSITPSGFRAVDTDFSPIMDGRLTRPPVEITDSLTRFRADYPDITKTAFIMMQFGATPAHQRILAGIRAALDPHDLVALRADDRQYHDDLYYTTS